MRAWGKADGGLVLIRSAWRLFVECPRLALFYRQEQFIALPDYDWRLWAGFNQPFVVDPGKAGAEAGCQHGHQAGQLVTGLSQGDPTAGNLNQSHSDREEKQAEPLEAVQFLLKQQDREGGSG